LREAGHEARGQKQFGVLLTAADMIEYDGWADHRLACKTELEGDLVPWASLLAVGQMVEYEDATTNWRLCLEHLLSVQVEQWRNSVGTTVGEVVRGWHLCEEPFNELNLVKRRLAQTGLAIQYDEAGKWHLAIPNQHPLVRMLYDGTKWCGDVSAGVWSGALRQAPEGTVYRVGQARFGGVKGKCTLISIDALYGKDGLMAGD
jgi:hypothetical protein